MRSRWLFAPLLVVALPAIAATADLGVYGPTPLPFVVDPGERFSVAFTVSSQGPDPAERTRLTVSLPAGATLLPEGSALVSCRQQGSDVVCEDPFGQPLPAKAFVTYNLAVRAGAELSGSIHRMEARVTSDAADPSPGNNTYTRVVTTRRLLLVESDGDDGAGSLRRQIETMNATCGGELPCKIGFARDMRIEPVTPLPVITACNSAIDGGGTHLLPMRVELSGDRLPTGSGLEVRTSCSYQGNPRDGVVIRRLAIGGFPGNGISISTTGVQPPLYDWQGVEHVVDECYVGTDRTGTLAHANRLRGVAAATADGDVTVISSTISGNDRSGIAFWQVRKGNLISNRIGIGTDGAPLPNGASGLFVGDGSVISDRNEIAFNREYGVSTAPAGRFINSQNVIRDNGDLPIDIGINGPSRVGAVQPPVLLDAQFDPVTGKTTVRGRLRGERDALDRGVFTVYLAAASHRNERGYAGAEVPLIGAYVPTSGLRFDTEFSIQVNRDLRGLLVVGYTGYALFADLPTATTSELGDAVSVH